MPIQDIVGGYPGALPDQIRAFLEDQTGATGSINDLWMKYLGDQGYTGALADRLRQWLLVVTSSTDVGQSVADLWNLPISLVSLFIDTYGGALAAFSVARKLRNAYTGAAFRVRRSSDNAETDIGFDGNHLVDTTALLAFVGANDGFVTVIYDQSANGHDVDQTTTSRQPTIVSAGSLVTMNGNPVMDFSSGDRFTSAVQFAANTDEMLGYVVEQHTGTVQGVCWGYMGASISGAETALYLPYTAATTDGGVEVSSTGGAAILAGIPLSTPQVIRTRAKPTSTTLAGIRVNTGAETTSTPTSTSSAFGSTRPIIIGGKDNSSTLFVGHIGELIIYPSFDHAATDALDTDLMDFWSIP